MPRRPERRLLRGGAGGRAARLQGAGAALGRSRRRDGGAEGSAAAHRIRRRRRDGAGRAQRVSRVRRRDGGTVRGHLSERRRAGNTDPPRASGLPAGDDRESGAAHAMRSIERLLWDSQGARRIPTAAAFDRAVSRLPRGELPRHCEFNPWAPIYLIPTRPFLRGLARAIRETGARRVLEVAAGDGHLARSLAQVAPDLRISATDSAALDRPQARINNEERRTL